MVQKIITSTNKQEWRILLGKWTKSYNLFYFMVVIVAFCIAILPFQLNWVSSAITEPREAVVRIETGTETMGTGFLISPKYILTARHVVEDLELGEKVQVYFTQAKIPLEVKATVEYYKKFNYSRFNSDYSPELADYLSYFESDVALLRLSEEVTQISGLQLGSSAEIKAGNVLLMGYGLNDWSEPDGKITSSSFHENNSLFKLDGSVNKGHSGGPVMLLENGKPSKVIGIVVGDFSTIFTEASGNMVKGESVALKIHHAERILSIGGYSNISQ